MEDFGLDMNSTGSVLTKRELCDVRKKRGECLVCGRKCFKKKLLKMIPITDAGKVLNGRCLRCNPLAENENESDVFDAAVTNQDMDRFSRTLSNFNLFGSRGGRSVPNMADSAHSSSSTKSSSASARNFTSTAAASVRNLGARQQPQRQNRSNAPGSKQMAGRRCASVATGLTTGANNRTMTTTSSLSALVRPKTPEPIDRNRVVRDNTQRMNSVERSVNVGETKTPVENTIVNGQEKATPTHSAPKPTISKKSDKDLGYGLKRQQQQPVSQLQTVGPTPRGSITLHERRSSLDTGINRHSTGTRAKSGKFPRRHTMDVTPDSDSQDSDDADEFSSDADFGSSIRTTGGRRRRKRTGPGHASLAPPADTKTDHSVYERFLQVQQNQHDLFDDHHLRMISKQKTQLAQHATQKDLLPRISPFSVSVAQKQHHRRNFTIDDLDSARGDCLKIISILRESYNSCYLQAECLKELSNIPLSEEQLNMIDDYGGLEVIIDSMGRYPSETELQLYGIRTIWNSTGITKNQIRYVQAGALDIILMNMDRYLDESDFQECIIGTISNLGAAEANLPILIDSGTIQRIVEMMNKHSYNRQICIKACCAITNMTSHHLNKGANTRSNISAPSICYQKDIMAMGAGGVVVISMVSHPKDAEVQEKALRAVRILSSDDEENKITLAQIGAIDAVVSAMQVHRNEADIQEAGASSLSNLAKNNNKTRAAIGDCGGIDVVIRAMWVHSDNVKVQEWSCRALFTLTHYDEYNGNIALEVGGISAIINAMQGHVDSSMIQQMGCATLANLACCNSVNNDAVIVSEANKMRIVDEEALDAIVLAMVLFSDDIKVQEYACQVILELAIIDNFKAMLASNVRQLVQTAGEKFPNTACQEYASALLQVFEEYAAIAQSQSQR